MFASELAKKYNWGLPTVCPCCGVNLEVNDSGEVFCPNDSCAKKIEHAIIKMSNKWNVLEIGPRIVEDFVKEANIKSLAQFLREIDSPILDNVAGKNAEKIRKNLKAAMSTKRTLANFISAFDIEDFGERRLQTLVDAGYNTIESFFEKANARDISNIKGWTLDSGIKVLQALSEIKKDLLEVSKLCNIGEEEKKEGKFSGLSFCFTGPNDYEPSEKRKLLEEKVAQLGGTVESVKNGLSYLVSSETGTAKMVKAEKLGIATITYEEFYKMMEA